DPVEDLTPIVPVSRQEWVLLINPKGPFESFEDLLKTGKEDPEALSAGAGAAGYQLATLMLAKHAGIEVNVIPYNGTPGAVQDLIGNRLSFIIVDAGSVLSYIESETLIPLVALA